MRRKLCGARALIVVGGVWLLGSVGFSAQTDAMGVTYPIVDTGQEKSYDYRGQVVTPKAGAAWSGQDAQHKGNTPSYRNNGDGTVTDLVTGLMWTQGFEQMAWSDAEAGARKNRTGGYDDWRVPTIKELYSLILFSGSTGTGNPSGRTPPRDARPYIDTKVFKFEYPTRNRFIDAQYISSTSYVGKIFEGAEGFFGVNFADGRIKCYPKFGRRGATWYIRYVRGNPDYGKNRFVDNQDGTVTDEATGLMWTQEDSGAMREQVREARARAGWEAFIKENGAMNWGISLAFAQRLEYAGYDDWRIPNAKELQSLVDYTRSPQTTRSAAIDPIFLVTGIRDEAGEADFPWYWSSTTHLDGRPVGSMAVYVAFGEALGQMYSPVSRRTKVMDVHGAGAQRSDPKLGQPQLGMGPQGDARRVFNFVRLVRDVKK